MKNNTIRNGRTSLFFLNDIDSKGFQEVIKNIVEIGCIYENSEFSSYSKQQYVPHNIKQIIPTSAVSERGLLNYVIIAEKDYERS
jgi:hypothetical protein